MPPLVWLVGAAFIVLAIVAAWRQRDAWPFSHYPMFSPLVRPDEIVVFRIAIEDSRGEVAWWRPRFFRLQDRLATRVEELMRRPPGGLSPSPDLLALVAQTRSLLLADGHPLAAGSAVLFVRRRIVRRDNVFATCDEIVARVTLPESGP